MRKNLFSLLSFAFLFSMVAFYSCKKATTEAAYGSVTLSRTDFLANKTFSEVKNAYNASSESAKKALWVDKLAQLEKQNLPEAHKTLILSLKAELSKTDMEFALSNPVLKNIAVNLAKITPEADFYAMFGELQNYQYTDKFVGTSISTALIQQLETYVKVIEPVIANRAIPCNCYWTCRYGTGGCRATSSGCGFLHMTGCDGIN
jgi:hypothetical protein